MLNTIRLKERIADLGLSQRTIAANLKLSQPVVSQKLRGIRPLQLHEAEALAKLLEIEPAEFCSYFFCPRNCETQNNELGKE